MSHKLLLSLVKRFKSEIGDVSLLLLLVGGTIIVPLLAFVGTGLKAGIVYEAKTEELYAADAGVEYVLWHMAYGDLDTLFPSYDEYDYSNPWGPSNLPEQINNEAVTVTLENIWIPKDMTVPNPAQTREIFDSGKLTIVGSSGTSYYQLRAEYFAEEGEDLKVEEIGVWLPSGFSYSDDSSNLEDNPLATYYSIPEVQPHCGGQAVVWDFNPPIPFSDLPNMQGSNPFIGVITFNYSGPTESNPITVSWIKTNGVASIPFSYDERNNVYKVTSIADSTSIESYIISAFGKNLSAFAGPLVADTDITLDMDNTVNGDIYYGGTFSYKAGLKHDGEEIIGEPPLPTQQEMDEFVDSIKQQAIDGGTHVGDLNIPMGSGDTYLGGPLYISGDLSIGAWSNVILDGPIYVEGSIDMDKDSEFSGTGSIVAVGSVYLAKTSTYDSNNDSVIMSLTNDIVFKKEVDIRAVIWALNGNVRFDKEAHVIGNVIANNIIAARLSTFSRGNYFEEFKFPGYTAGDVTIRTWDID